MCVIQTPIEVSMNFNYVMKTVENEFNLLSMLSYEPLWNTMKNRNITTYTLINTYNINPRNKQNYISGFWEFHIYSERHSNFPEDMRITA